VDLLGIKSLLADGRRIVILVSRVLNGRTVISFSFDEAQERNMGVFLSCHEV